MLSYRSLKVFFTTISFVLPILFGYAAFATHSCSATPVGGTYDSPQSVTLQSDQPTATIYYTLDGSDPDTNSSQYDGNALEINTNITLKFFAVDPADNHTSAIVTEEYTIDMSPPTIIDTDPNDGSRRVDTFSIINATFSEPMNSSTINTDTFVILNEIGDSVSGSVTYDDLANTASFSPDTALTFGEDYTATVTIEVRDQAGNSLEESHSWTFTLGGQIVIILSDAQTFANIPGSAFTITPNPFTLESSLEVEDNGPFDSDLIEFGVAFEGIIIVDNVENDFTTYQISETLVPEGYSKLYGDGFVTVVEADACGEITCNAVSSLSIENVNSSSTISDVGRVITVPPPYLDKPQFDLYQNKVIIGKFSGIYRDPALPTFGPVNEPSDTALGFMVTSENINEADPDSFNFDTAAPETSSAQDLFESYLIPTYPGPTENVASDVIYDVPPIVIPYADSENNFILTPIIDHVFSGETLFMHQLSFVENKVARFERVNMTFNTAGNNVGFSFGITDTHPPGTTSPPLDAKALFLDVGFVGDVDFSDPNAFLSSPKIEILVNKTLTGFDELPDGCSDFVMLLFDEKENEWITVQKLRNPTSDTGADTPDDPTDDKCGFMLEPPHFSTFAVGGVKGSTLVTEAVLGSVRGGGGGGSSSTSIRQMVSGENVLVTTDVGTESVISRFESVEPGSGQLKIESGSITNFEELFDEIVNVPEASQKQGIIQLNDAEYSTVGTIFDVDATDVNFRGMFDITIPYKEDIVSLSFGSESDVRLLHYNTELMQWEDVTIAVDQGTNTVTGRMNSSSPVVAALLMPVDNPTKTFRMSDVTILDPVTNLKRLEITKGEVVTVTVMLENMAPSSSDGQTFVFIVEVLDENGMATDISVQNGSLDGRNSIELARSWTENETGLYNLKIFVWTDLVEPSALSDVATTQVRVS